MSWIVVDASGKELIYTGYNIMSRVDWVEVPKGTAEKLTGKPMTWDDEPRELV